MAICKFFQRGNCRYGENCRNEHPRNTSSLGGGNRFGVLQQDAGGGGGRFDATRQSQQPEDKYGLSKTDISNDLTAGKNRPEWVFSCYAPAKNVPIHLLGGPQREQSFEEMRAAHYAAVASGTPEKAIQEANNMYTEAEQQMKAVLNDLDGAIKYVINGEYEHPNRLDIIEGKTGSSTGPGTGFNKWPPIQPQPLQQPPASSPFGQPSTSTNAPGFGQPAFGQPSGFGQPTPIGGNQPGFGQSGFPQTQQGPGLGQPTPSPFAQASNQNQAGGFGQFSNQTVPGTGFGQLASNASSPFAQSKPEASPFGQATPAAPAPASNPFGAPAPTMNTPFAQPAPFASSAAPAPSTQQTSLQETKKSGFTRIIEKKLSGLPHLTGQTVHDPTTKKLRTWKGQPVTYVADDNPSYPHPQDPTVLVHIFFPDGPPLPATLKDAQAKDEEYTPDVEAAYKFAKQHGHFKDGVIPKVPPKSEWCSFDF